MSKQREAFEAWHLATFKEKAPDYPLDPEFSKRFQDPVWMAWQASRAAALEEAAGLTIQMQGFYTIAEIVAAIRALKEQS